MLMNEPKLVLNEMLDNNCCQNPVDAICQNGTFFFQESKQTRQTIYKITANPSVRNSNAQFELDTAGLMKAWRSSS